MPFNLKLSNIPSAVLNSNLVKSEGIKTIAGTASNTAGDAIKISPNQSWFGRLPNATVADVHAIGYDPVGAAAATASAIVAALLDDVA